MPELPEVETIARGLRATLPGRKIIAVRLGKTDFIDDPGTLEHSLPGLSINEVVRYGKFLLLRLSAANGEPASSGLLVHLGMTGHLSPKRAEEPALKHTHAVFTLDDGRELRYTASRRCCWISAFCAASGTFMPTRVSGARRFIRRGSARGSQESRPRASTARSSTSCARRFAFGVHPFPIISIRKASPENTNCIIAPTAVKEKTAIAAGQKFAGWLWRDAAAIFARDARKLREGFGLRPGHIAGRKGRCNPSGCGTSKASSEVLSRGGLFPRWPFVASRDRMPLLADRNPDGG